MILKFGLHYRGLNVYNIHTCKLHFFKLSLFLALSLDNEHERMLKGSQIKSSSFSSNSGVIKQFNVMRHATS